jgi:N-acetylglucosamine-6-phosphate deacetylase
MASLNPARVISLSNRIGKLAAGMDANLAVVDSGVNVWMTMMKGEIVYTRL